MIARLVLTFYLDIHRRRQSKVQDLRDHVCRQEIERGARELAGQDRTQRPDVIGGRVVFGAQRHEYVAIGGADHA